MPEYEYYCKSCGKRFSAVMHVKEHDEQMAECPECHKKQEVEKLMPSEVNVFTTRKSSGYR